MIDEKLRSWIIFKNVLFQKIWHEVYKKTHFICTKNDWINNEINLF